MLTSIKIPLPPKNRLATPVSAATRQYSTLLTELCCSICRLLKQSKKKRLNEELFRSSLYNTRRGFCPSNPKTLDEMKSLPGKKRLIWNCIRLGSTKLILIQYGGKCKTACFIIDLIEIVMFFFVFF